MDEENEKEQDLIWIISWLLDQGYLAIEICCFMWEFHKVRPAQTILLLEKAGDQDHTKIEVSVSGSSFDWRLPE